MSQKRYIHQKTANVRFLDTTPSPRDKGWTRSATFTGTLRGGLRTRNRPTTIVNAERLYGAAGGLNAYGLHGNASLGVTWTPATGVITKTSKVAGGK